MNRTVLLLSACALSLTACAAEPSGAAKPAVPAKAAATAQAPAAGEAAVRAALAKLVPGIVIDRLQPAPIAGFAEVATGGRIVYVSNDGKYLMQGTLLQVDGRQNLTEMAEGSLRKGVLEKVGADRRIIFSPANPKHRVTVFTDIDCGYCRKMHNQMAEYNKLGIAVEYLFYPRAGIGSESFDKAVSVWCAPDRLKAMTDAKADRPVPKKTCNNPITMDYDLGQRVGVDGTPAIYAMDGTQVGGYLEPAQLLARLEQVAARQAK